MIRYRCWYCDKLYYTPEERIGKRFDCACGHTLKVPRRSGGRSRVKRPIDWVVETLVYGGGGALLGLGLGVLLAGEIVFLFRRTAYIMLGFAVLGFLLGTFGGERGINWLGRLIRDREQR
jgi:hypothetical protein